MSSGTFAFDCEPLGDRALLLRFGDTIDQTLNGKVHAAAAMLRAARFAGIDNLVTAYASLALHYDPVIWSRAGNGGSAYENLRLSVALCLAEASTLTPAEFSEMPVPVCYGGAFGEDLETLAAHARLSISEIIARHVAPTYVVAMLGFSPGFPYLIGLDPALHAPRRDSPRIRVPSGSVGIGGGQTGIYPRELPGGWQLIGRTPLTLFDSCAAAPAAFAAGQRVRFHAIDADQFKALLG